MDMRRHLNRWLSITVLSNMADGAYEGIIEKVSEESLNNKFAGQRQIQPVIKFTDGWQIVPNMTMRRASSRRWDRKLTNGLAIECAFIGIELSFGALEPAC